MRPSLPAHQVANSPQQGMIQIPGENIATEAIQMTSVKKTFNFTVATYISWLNQNLAQSGIKKSQPFTATTTRAIDGGMMYMGLINQHLGVVIYESIDEMVSSVFFTGQGDGSAESGTDVIAAAMAVVRATNQTSAREKRTGKLTLELVKADQEVIVKDGIEYRPSIIDAIGFMLTISPTANLFAAENK